MLVSSEVRLAKTGYFWCRSGEDEEIIPVEVNRPKGYDRQDL
jgi:hypothetical protein